jgi:uncharacterized protein (TIGR02466 family)
VADAPFKFAKSAMLFPSPVLSYEIADAARINAGLLREIQDRRNVDPSVVRSNRAGWHSESDFFQRKEPAHTEASVAISKAIADATKRVAGQGALKTPVHIQINGWVNINPPFAYNVPHDHPGSFWSGCYYIATDHAEDKSDEGGAITFIDGRCAPTGQPIVKAPVFHGSYTLRPAPGTLLVFPSNIKHWVHPNSSDQERVTMAFNVFIYAKRP